MGNAIITAHYRCSYNYACVENLPNSTAGMLSCVCVCVCVCVSLPALAASASIYICNQRYSRVSLRRFLDFDLWVFVQKLWR